jgi:hypothetical protein
LFVKLRVEREDNMESALTKAKQEKVDELIRQNKGKNAVDLLLAQRVGSEKHGNYQQWYRTDGAVLFVNLDRMTVKVSEPDSKSAKIAQRKVKAIEARAERKIEQEKLEATRKDRKQREAEKKAAPKTEPKPKAVRKPRAKKAQAEPTKQVVNPLAQATVVSQ